MKTLVQRLDEKISLYKGIIHSDRAAIQGAHIKCYGIGEEWEDRKPGSYDVRMMHEEQERVKKGLRRHKRRLARYEQRRGRIIAAIIAAMA